MAGRLPLPTNIHKLNGTAKKNPKRMKARENEPQPKEPLGNPPTCMTTEAKRCWRELVKIAPPDVLKDADRWAVQMASELMAEFRDDPRAFAATKLGRLENLIARFGMTPADRVRLQVPKQKEKSRFDD